MTKNSRHLLIIHNPISGSRNKQRFSKAASLLQAAGCKLTIKTTERSNHAIELVGEALAENQNWSAIVAAGGDGTICEVANGLRGSSIPLGVIPLGTANVFAREIGVGMKLENVATVIASALPVPIYPGLIAEERFLLMVGAGYDSLAVSGLIPEEKKKYGAAAYILAALRALKHFKHLDVSIRINGEIRQGASVIVSRSRLFGGPFVAAPKGDLRNSDFQVLILKKKGIWPAVKYGLALVTNRIASLDTVEYLQTEDEVEITASPSIPCQIDGDGGFETPHILRIDDKPLHILAAYSKSPQR